MQASWLKVLLYNHCMNSSDDSLPSDESALPTEVEISSQNSGYDEPSEEDAASDESLPSDEDEVSHTLWLHIPSLDFNVRCCPARCFAKFEACRADLVCWIEHRNVLTDSEVI